MEKLVLVPYEKYQRLLGGKTMGSSEKKKRRTHPKTLKDRAEKKVPTHGAG